MTIKDLETWNKFSDLDDYSKIFIQALKPGLISCKENLVRIAPLNLHTCNIAAKPENSTGCVYRVGRVNLFVERASHQAYLWDNGKPGKNVPTDVLTELLTNRMDFLFFTTSPEVKQAFNRLEKFNASPGWWRVCINHLQPKSLECRIISKSIVTGVTIGGQFSPDDGVSFNPFWRDNIDETIHPDFCYRIKL